MRRNWDSIKDADVSKIRVRSKAEIIDKIVFLENEYRIEQQKKREFESRGDFHLMRLCEDYMNKIHNDTILLDWVLHINPKLR